jgi:hypothetical protein
MILSDNFADFLQFHNLSLLLLHYSKLYNRISDFFEFWIFQTHNAKAMAKDKNVNIAVS